MTVTRAPVDEGLAVLGEQTRRARIAAGITQDQLAADADISVGALRNLELGRGGTLTTFLRVLRALGREDWLATLEPAPTLSPLALARAREGLTERKRAPRRPR